MAETPKRTQYINYNLMNKFIFSPVEHAILNLIMTRPHYYLENLATLGASIGRSVRTVQRAINKLLEKGILTRKYTNFKRLVLKITSLEDQEKIAKGGVVKQILKFCSFAKYKKNKAKAADTTPTSCDDTTPTTGSINKSNIKKSIIKNELNLGQKYTNLEKNRLDAIKLLLLDKLNLNKI